MKMQSEVLFKRDRIFRRPFFLLMGTVMFSVGVSGIWYIWKKFFPGTWSPGTVLSFIVYGAFFLLTFSVGVWVLGGWITDRHVTLQISGSGIQYGKRFFPWENVKSFWGEDLGYGIVLYVRTKGVWRWKRHLDVHPTLDEDEYFRLIDALANTVQKKHPHLRLNVLN